MEFEIKSVVGRVITFDGAAKNIAARPGLMDQSCIRIIPEDYGTGRSRKRQRDPCHRRPCGPAPICSAQGKKFPPVQPPQPKARQVKKYRKSEHGGALSSNYETKKLWTQADSMSPLHVTAFPRQKGYSGEY